MIRSRSRTALFDEAPTTVDLAPLIDVVFILLIFFLLTTTFSRDRALAVHRPVASHAAASPRTAVRVYMTAGGRVLIDGAPAAHDELRGMLRERLRSAGDPAVVIVPDRTIQAGDLVRVMDLVASLGVVDVAIATREEEGAAP